MATLARMNVDLVARADQFNDTLDSAADKMKSVGNRLTGIGQRLSTRVTLPLAAIGGASVKMAADAEEAANKFNVVMGGATNEVRADLERLAATIPLTQSQLEQMSAGIQDMLVPMGLARDQAAGMSVDMVQLAGDLASFNNVPTTRVLEAMQSALAGASEPMRRFGVDTRKTRLQQLALSEGLIQAGEELDTTAQAQAVMIAIQRDSTDAMGDAERTVNDFTNSARFLLRDLKELGTTIGQMLIPVLSPLIARARDLVNWFRDLSKPMQVAITAAGGVAAALGPIAVVAGTVISSLGTLVAAAGTVGTALTGLNPAVAVAVAAFVSVTKAVQVVVEHWSVLAFETKRAMKFVVKAIRTVFVKPFGKLVDKIILPVINKIIDGYNKLADIVGMEAVPRLEADVVASFDSMVDGMQRAAEIGAFEVSSRFKGLKDSVTGSVDTMKARVSQSVQEMSSNAQAHTQDMVQKINDMAREMEVEMVGKARAMGSGTEAEFKEMNEAAQRQTEDMNTGVTEEFDNLSSNLLDKTQDLLSALGIEWEGLRKVETIFSSVMGAVRTDWGQMLNTLTQDLPQFVSGMVDAFSTIGSKIGDAFGFIRDFFSQGGAFGPSGPGDIGGRFKINLPDLNFLETAFAFQDAILRDIQQAVVDLSNPLMDIRANTSATAGGIAELVQSIHRPNARGAPRSGPGSNSSGGAASRTANPLQVSVTIQGNASRDDAEEIGRQVADQVDSKLGRKYERERRRAGDARL